MRLTSAGGLAWQYMGSLDGNLDKGTAIPPRMSREQQDNLGAEIVADDTTMQTAEKLRNMRRERVGDRLTTAKEALIRDIDKALEASESTFWPPRDDKEKSAVTPEMSQDISAQERIKSEIREKLGQLRALTFGQAGKER